jgi:hypothetical protein
MTIISMTPAEWHATSRYGTLRVVVLDEAAVHLLHASLGPAGGIMLGDVLTALKPTDSAPCPCPLPGLEDGAGMCRALQPGSVYDPPGARCGCACHASVTQEEVLCPTT